MYSSFFIGAVTQLVQEHLNDGPELDEKLIEQSFEMLWAAYTKPAIGSTSPDDSSWQE
ncbi:MAG: hypothetical protein ACLFTE_06270 [Salinivenus sp.]